MNISRDHSLGVSEDMGLFLTAGLVHDTEHVAIQKVFAHIPDSERTVIENLGG